MAPVWALRLPTSSLSIRLNVNEFNRGGFRPPSFFVGLAARGKSRAGAKNGDCHQFAPPLGPRSKALALKRIGWLYPLFRNLLFYHGLVC